MFKKILALLLVSSLIISSPMMAIAETYAGTESAGGSLKEEDDVSDTGGTAGTDSKKVKEAGADAGEKDNTGAAPFFDLFSRDGRLKEPADQVKEEPEGRTLPSENEAESEAETESKVETENKAETESRAEAGADAETEAEPETESGTEAELETETAAGAESGNRSEQKEDKNNEEKSSSAGEVKENGTKSDFAKDNSAARHEAAIDEETEKEPETEIPPELKKLNLRMLLRIGEDMIPADRFNLYNNGSYFRKPEEDIAAGELEKVAPDLSRGNRYFDHAEVNGKRVYSVGMLGDTVYYGSLTGILTVLEDNETIDLYYVMKFDVDYDIEGAKAAADNPEKVTIGHKLSFYITPSSPRKTLKVLVTGSNGYGSDLSKSGRVTDRLNGTSLFTVENVKENLKVTVTEEEVDYYRLSCDNANLKNGTFHNLSNDYGMQKPGGDFYFTLTSSPGTGNHTWSLPWKYEQYHLNKFEINGEEVDFPHEYPDYGKYNENLQSYSTLSTGEKIEVYLRRIYTLPNDKNRWLYEYRVTVSNVNHDITITNVNFKKSLRDEIIIRELDGVKNITGYDNYESRYLPGKSNMVYMQTNGYGNEFYFNLIPGYRAPMLKLVSNGVTHDEIKVEENRGYLKNGKDPSFDHDTYNWRFDVPGGLGDNVELYISAEPINYTIMYVNDKDSSNVITAPEDGFTVGDGKKSVFTVTPKMPRITDREYYTDGWLIRGDASGRVYRASDAVNIADVLNYASDTGIIELIPHWVDVKNGEQRTIGVNIHIEDPLGNGNDRVLAGSYNGVVSNDGRGIFKLDEEQALNIIRNYLIEHNAVRYSVNDYVIPEDKELVIIGKDTETLDLEFDLKKTDLNVAFEWGSAEDEPSDGKVTLPESFAVESAVGKPVQDIPYEQKIPEGYMAEKGITAEGLNGEGGSLTIYLYKDTDNNGIPDTQNINVQFKADSYTVKGRITDYALDTRIKPVLGNEDSILTYTLLKNYRRYKLTGNGKTVTEYSDIGDTYPYMPDAEPVNDKYERLRWIAGNGSDPYEMHAGLSVGAFDNDISYTAEYGVKDVYNNVTVKYVDHNDTQKELAREYSEPAAVGDIIWYPLPKIAGYVNPAEDTAVSYRLDRAEDKTILVEYYADNDNNRKPDDLTVKLDFKGIGDGTWLDNWSGLTEGRDYKILGGEAGAPIILEAYLIKENDAGFDADVYPAVPYVRADQEHIFDRWDNENDSGKTYGTADDGTVVGSSLPADAHDRSYIPVYSEDKNHDGIGDNEEYITVIFKAGDNGVLLNAEGGSEAEISFAGLLPEYDVYPAAPHIEAESGYTFDGWDSDYYVGELIHDKTMQQVFIARYDHQIKEDGGKDTNGQGTGGHEDTGNDNTGNGNAGGSKEDDNNGGDNGDAVANRGGDDNNYHYVVGVTGNWRHMDNEDINAGLDEAVPQEASAMDAPEWHRWKFFKTDGIMLYDQWAYITNPYAAAGQPAAGWFYFENNGLMKYGWYLDRQSGKWYYLHSISDGMLGTMMTGWHHDENDGRWYYLDPGSGAMALGWQKIGGKWYYFNQTPEAETWSFDSMAGIWRFDQSKAKPLGSMYADETTPDGYHVNKDGAWVQ